MSKNREAFNNQAGGFDARAGLPDELAHEVAAAALRVAGASPDDLLLEMGAGTGQIGEHFLGRIRYRGVDTSDEMLEQFRTRAPDADLVRGDAEDRWPAADGEARVIFGSRVFHLFEPATLLREARRVGPADGATLLEGRVQRDYDSPREWLRRELQQCLREMGADYYEPRWAVADAFADEADVEHIRKPIVRWQEAWLPGRHIRYWATKKRLAGVRCEPDVRSKVLDEIRASATARFGDLESPQACGETYTLVGVRWGF